MKASLLASILGLGLTFSPFLTPLAQATGPLLIDGVPLESSITQLCEDTTYVSLREVSSVMLPHASLSWDGTQASLSDEGLSLTAQPGQNYIEVNGRVLYVEDGVRLENGCTLIPVRVLISALGGTVDWEAETGTVTVTSGEEILQAEQLYDADDLYWLSRIISAESQGEPLEGKLAVGNVVLNRVDSIVFPDSIYGVIFDDRWGGQFEPVHNGTVYNDPTEESLMAAKMVLEGANTAQDSLYFIAPDLTDNHWVMENREYVVTIGYHWFYR